MRTPSSPPSKSVSCSPLVCSVFEMLLWRVQGAGWPFRAIRELQAGTLLEDDSNITVSPR